MDREVMMREAFGVREACFRFAMKASKLSDEPYVRRGSSRPKSEMLPLSLFVALSLMSIAGWREAEYTRRDFGRAEDRFP